MKGPYCSATVLNHLSVNPAISLSTKTTLYLLYLFMLPTFYLPTAHLSMKPYENPTNRQLYKSSFSFFGCTALVP